MKSPRASRSTALPSGVEVDLVAVAEHAPALEGCEERVDRLLGLIGTGRRHPVLVGPSEVGKTATVHELARRIAQGARPGGASAVWQVSLRTLDAVAGKDEGAGPRLAKILREADASPQRPIVFVRDLRMLRAFDAEHHLVEALSHTRALFLGEAGPQLASWLVDDAELASVLHVVRVEEPSEAKTLALLEHQARGLRSRERISVDPAALERIVRYAARLMPQRKFPGKALALLDEAAREAAARPERRVTAAGVTDRVCESLRLPRFLIDPDTAFDVDGLREYLRARVVGQDEAIDAIVQSLALYKADLSDERRPLGVLLLAGPSGVGKTLLARLVAEYVFGTAARLVRVSLAEHSEDWKVDQLFGQRSAQSTESRRGLLARQLSGKPFSVLLLDEIEKAHGLAYKHLLRPLDEGTFVNGNDEEVSLRNTLVLMTSSVGAEVYREPGLGFARGEAASARAESVRKRVADLFPGDLLDRVDRVCVCPPLGGGDLREVARREVEAALARAGVARRGVSIELDEGVLARVIAEGVAVQAGGSGARAVRRAVERAVVAPLALFLLRAEPAPGTRIVVTMRDGAVVPEGFAPVVAAPVRRARNELRVGAGSRAEAAAVPRVLPSANDAAGLEDSRASAKRTARSTRASRE